MTRTVEEVAEALFDLHGWNGPSDNAGGLRNTILAALREARDAALHEAARHYDAAEGSNPIRPRHVAAFLRRLASSPLPAERGTRCPAEATGNPVDCGGCAEHAAPARDDRGAERLRILADGLDPDPEGSDRGWQANLRRELLAIAASSSGEVTALRRDWPSALNDAWKAGRKAGIEEAAKACAASMKRQRTPEQKAVAAALLVSIRVLAAPSQETGSVSESVRRVSTWQEANDVPTERRSVAEEARRGNEQGDARARGVAAMSEVRQEGGARQGADPGRDRRGDDVLPVEGVRVGAASPRGLTAAAPSQETETRCKVCGTARPRGEIMLACRDGHACLAALESEDAAPASSAAPDTGKEPSDG
jgi:hypothetical protein